MSGRVLITGGAGFIGSHLVDRLVADGCAVTVLDDFSSGKPENLDEARKAGDVRVVEGSILDENALADALAGCDRVFHLAVQCVRRSLGRPLENHHVNATGSLLTLEAARRAGVRRFVYCSSSEVYGNSSDGVLDEESTPCKPVTVYGAAKLAGEQYALAYHQTYGMPTAVVRPFNAYGPREHDQGDLAEVIPRFVIRALNGLPPVIFGTGDAGRDFTYVTETAAGLAAAGTCDAVVGRVVNIARGEMITIAEVARTVLRLCRRGDLAPTHIAARPGDVHRLRAVTDRAADLLGFRADIGFEEGLERYLAWFVGVHPDPSLLLEENVVNWTIPPAPSSAD
jgi:UDP-glucose 4-epimerase